jgi:hypothetical protein
LATPVQSDLVRVLPKKNRPIGGKRMKMKAVRVALLLLLALCLLPATPTVLAGGDDPPAFGATGGHRAVLAKRLTGQIDYWLVAGLGIRDDEGRLLVWEGTIVGDFNGTMKWWFIMPPPFASVVNYPGGRVNYYAARWEIWDPDRNELLLAGDSAGKTVTPGEPGAWGVGIWDGDGVVTEARRGLHPLKGRHIYETGPVISNAEAYPGTLSGTGLFVIY